MLGSSLTTVAFMNRCFSVLALASGVFVVLPFGACSGDSSPGAHAGKQPEGGTECPPSARLSTDCDPIGFHCGFPFPSNVYLEDDPTGKNPSGKRVAFGATTLPKTQGKAPVDPSLFYGLDGFSPASTAMTYLPGATATGLATPADIASTLDPGSPTIVLDADTGELVPHFVDIDQQAANDDQRALMIHPAVLLTNGHRYVVAIRHVKDGTGADIAPAPEFAALRDGTASPDASVESRRCLYEELFGKLEKAGVQKGELQVAWDFTVGTRDSITSALVKVRDAALAAVGDDGPDFVVKEVTENPNAHTLRRIVLTMKAPLYLSSATYSAGDPPPKLLFDDGGVPRQNGTLDVDVLVQVPNSVSGGEKHGLVQNGHGLFGSKEEGQDTYLAEFADGWHWITFAVDFFGFSSADVPMAAEALASRPELLPGFVERQIQGHVNQLVAMRLMKGKVARDGLTDASGAFLLDPAWIDASVRAYRGDSQGGIMGATYMTISTDVTRGYLGEPGTPYSVLLNRSKDSAAYNGILVGSYPDARDVQLMWGLVQLEWDRSEPSGFAPFMTTNTLPGTPPHHVLMADGLGDHQVTTLGAHILSRAVGAKLVQSNDPSQPVVRDVFGLTQAAAPLSDASGLVEWDFALAPEPLGNEPPLDGCDPHDRIRRTTPSYAQSDQFLRTGTIAWFCDGVCNCDGPREEDGCASTYKSECCSSGSTDPKCH